MEDLSWMGYLWILRYLLVFVFILILATANGLPFWRMLALVILLAVIGNVERGEGAYKVGKMVIERLQNAAPAPP